MKKLILITGILLSTSLWANKYSTNLLTQTAFENANTDEIFHFKKDGAFEAKLNATIDGEKTPISIQGAYEAEFVPKSQYLPNKLYVMVFWDSYTCKWDIQEKGNFYWFERIDMYSNVSNICSDLLVNQILPVDGKLKIK
jgi:hypothetical protein